MAAHAHDATQTPPTTPPAESTRTPDRPRERSSASPTRETDRPPSDTSCDASPRGHQDERPSERQDTGTGQRSTAEWITLAISSLIVLSLIGLTSYFYLTVSTAPASVEVEPHLSQTYQAGGRFYLPVTVRNSGGETGEEVRVRVTLTDTSGRQEEAEFQVQFLAGGGSSRAMVAFGSDPRQGQIEAGVTSYLEP
jgi:uncharacterized protein (TIGR02588 family)